MIRHIQRPELAPDEDEFNRLMRQNRIPTDGMIEQVCMHVDRTITTMTGSPASRTECDYCAAVVFDQGWGPIPDLMPTTWMEKL